MTAKRESLYASGSIGRVQGAQVSRTASFETLTAHPLLSTTGSPPPSTVPQDASSPPKYVPYTPKHRAQSAATTITGTTTVDSSPTSPLQHHGAATFKLQLMNLKAVAQNVGLDTTSVGWAMLEKIVHESDHSSEWTEIWNAITVGKASLLLPLEHATTHEKITPDFVKDHVILCDSSSRDNSPVITLSGFRAILSDETLTFRSSLLPVSKSFQDILGAFSRPSTLRALPPLKAPPLNSTPYPSFSVPAYIPVLPLPPRAAGLNKPPLPPRPNVRPPTTPSSSRLTTTFTSLFGKSTSSPPLNSSAPPATSPQPDNEHVIDISAFTIDRRIIGKVIGKAMNLALRAEIQESLAGLPSWIIDRVHLFTANMYPLVKAPKVAPAASSGKLSSSYSINTSQETPAEASEQFQNFYASLDEELRLGGSSLLGHHSEGNNDEDGNIEEIAAEIKIREILETVEGTVCSLFYDRIYLQSTSDDASHDEALSSRIAALNMLDLGLEHLDVDVGDAGSGIDQVIKTCGEKLTELDSSSPSPAAKAAILVAAHKVIVDGLSRLPPIRLRSEAEIADRKSLSFGLKQNITSPEQPNAPLLFQQSPSDEWHRRHPLSDVVSLSDSIPGMVIPRDEEEPTAPDPTSPTTQPQRGTSEPTASPLKEAAPLPASTPVSGDILLPLLIFSVVKANPPHMVSHLLYTQRFRNQSVGGEESYCLINLMAVAEFLENVDLAALGLADSENKVLSTAMLSPIPINRTPITTESSASTQDASGSLRGRVEQQVDAIAGSANRVISGVVGSSFGVLRLLLPGNQDTPANPNAEEVTTSPHAPTSWNNVRPGFGLLTRETGFSIAASIAASLPGGSGRAKSSQSLAEESGQPLLAVSRPPSEKSTGYPHEEEDSSEGGSGDEKELNGDGGGDDGVEMEGEHDSRSIRSFESMLTGKGRKGMAGTATMARKSLSDRLAHVSGFSRLQSREQEASLKGYSPQSRHSSLHPLPATRTDTPTSSRPPSPSSSSLRIAPPNQRFLECSEDDIRVSEVGELLREYRRVVEGLRAFSGFEE